MLLASNYYYYYDYTYEVQKLIQTIMPYFIASIVINICLVVASIIIASKKQRSKIWGLWVFLFGLIPFIILLCLDDLYINVYSTTKTNIWVCGNCGQKNTGVKCTNCGNSKYFKGKPYETYSKTNVWTCKTCGETNNTLKCTRCGAAKEMSISFGGEKEKPSWVCPKCGEKNNANAMNCINCFNPKPRN